MSQNEITAETMERLREAGMKMDEAYELFNEQLRFVPARLRERAKAYWFGSLGEALGHGLSPCDFDKFMQECEASVVTEEEDEAETEGEVDPEEEHSAHVWAFPGDGDGA